MSGICDTCKRNNDCRKPIGGMDSCRLYESGKESNYKKLFGTPERATDTMRDMCHNATACACCPLIAQDVEFCKTDSIESLFVWLESEARDA